MAPCLSCEFAQSSPLPRLCDTRSVCSNVCSIRGSHAERGGLSTLSGVTAHVKPLSVYFYALEPAQRRGGGDPSFSVGHYPLNSVFDTIRRLDPAAEDYRIADGLFAGETFCVLHEDGERPVLGSYYRDNLSKPLTEYKGEISELFLREGEALVDSAYAAFFPGDVVGLVRTSSKAPGFAKLSQWLSVQGGHPCVLTALRDPSGLAQLDGHPRGIRRMYLRMRRNRIAAVDDYSTDVAGALRAAAEVNHSSGAVGVEFFSPKGKEEQGQWSEQMRQEVEHLIGVLPDFEAAKVKVAGLRKDLNLLRANVQTQFEVTLYDTRRVGPHEAAEALFGAYAQEKGSIELALEARRGR